MTSRYGCSIVAMILVLAGCGDAGPPTSPAGGPVSKPLAPGRWDDQARAALDRGVDFLVRQAQGGKWAFDPELGPDVGITAIVATAILGAPGEGRLEAVRPALDWLVGLQKPDGSIHQGALASYCTAAAVLAFQGSRDPRYAPAIQRAAAYLESCQLDQAEGIEETAAQFGGFGYDDKKSTANPNLSTTQWVLEGARAAGVSDEEFYRKALVFLSRLQNHSETNDQVFDVDGQKASPGNDGGAIYQPSISKAGVERTADGRLVLRSYGSMSYALLKCYLLTDLDHRDQRVRAVLSWLREHWDLTRNPGMEHEGSEKSELMGLYYYYLTVARTLIVADRKGVPLEGPLADWRRQLAAELVRRQGADGSWINEQTRWWEGNRPLVTAYALLALGSTLQ